MGEPQVSCASNGQQFVFKRVAIAFDQVVVLLLSSSSSIFAQTGARDFELRFLVEGDLVV